ncbi:Os06g0192750 [Oryza sativa Japonica Group]|nr:Os06g0192750 [Oryza sativa Japonica Group]
MDPSNTGREGGGKGRQRLSQPPTPTWPPSMKIEAPDLAERSQGPAADHPTPSSTRPSSQSTNAGRGRLEGQICTTGPRSTTLCRHRPRAEAR